MGNFPLFYFHFLHYIVNYIYIYLYYVIIRRCSFSLPLITTEPPFLLIVFLLCDIFNFVLSFLFFLCVFCFSSITYLYFFFIPFFSENICFSCVFLMFGRLNSDHIYLIFFLVLF